jgi:hypothetical protein
MAPGIVLSPRKQAFVAARAQGMTLDTAASHIGVSARQVRRYSGDPLVKAAVVEAQAEALGDVVRAMTAGSRNALSVLASVMNDKRAADSVRVRAAMGWLEIAFRARELIDLEQRLTELERRVNHDS